MAEEGDGLRRGPDGVVRCWWPGEDPLYVRYHDDEWGRPVADEHRLFEKLCLEGFQSGLSWLTILRKRDNFREAFARFDPAVVAGFGPADVERLLGDAGIVRHRGKIESTINNARRALELESLAAHVWSFAPPADAGLVWPLPAKTEPSAALGKDLKRRGWTFVGPTIVYAFMQAVGMVNDHVEGCEFRLVAAEERARFGIPGSVSP